MALTQDQETKLRTLVEGMALDSEGKADELKQVFKDVLVSKFSKFFETVNAGTDSVKATLKAAADAEIKATGEAKADPKAAKGSADVKATLKAAADVEIKATGEAKADPKAAKGSADVKATLKQTADEEIKK